MKIKADSPNLESVLEIPTPNTINREVVDPNELLCNILLGPDSPSHKANLLELFATRQNPTFVNELSSLLDERNLLNILYNFYAEDPIIPQESLKLHEEVIVNVLCEAIQLHLHNATMFLVKAGANVNVAGEVGLTPLEYATRTNNPGAVELLVNREANVNVADTCGFTPLHCAAKFGDLGVISLLISRGANVNAVDKLHMTPLLGAIQESKLEAIELLVTLKADVNLKNSRVMLPLHYAAQYCKLGAIKLLVKQLGMKVDLRDSHDKTPFHYAAKCYDRLTVTKLLQALEANIEVDYSRPLDHSKDSTQHVPDLLGDGAAASEG